MNGETMSTLAEIVSAIAIVVSPVYLTIQVRTITKTLQANGAWDSEIIYGNSNLEVSNISTGATGSAEQ